MNERTKVVIYARFPLSATQAHVNEVNAKLGNYCNMIGADIMAWHSELADNARQQELLSKALHDIKQTDNMELVTVDFSSISANIGVATKTVRDINDMGGFVYFIDEESVVNECLAIEQHEEDEDGWN